MKPVIIFAVAVGVIAGCAIPAQAKDLRFGYYAYELESAEGRRHLLERLESRVARFCGVGGVMSLHAKQDAARCRDEMTEELVGKFGDARLVALYRGDAGVVARN